MKKYLKLLLVLLVMITIFMFSNDNRKESSEKSDGLIIRTTEILLNRKLSDKEKEIYLDEYVVYVRKTAHFTLYFLLGLTFISFLKEFNIENKKLFLYTIIFVFIYACSDEIHQAFVGRSCEVFDVLLDTLGGTTSSSLYILRRIKNEQKTSIS